MGNVRRTTEDCSRKLKTVLLAEKMEERKQQELRSVAGRCLKLEMPEMDFLLIPWGVGP